MYDNAGIKIVTEKLNKIIENSEMMKMYNLGMATGLYHFYSYIKAEKGEEIAKKYLYDNNTSNPIQKILNEAIDSKDDIDDNSLNIYKTIKFPKENRKQKFTTRQKRIFITNGMARSGKDTFAYYLNDFAPTIKYSSIDKVKEIAKECGWDGTKDEESRKFLSDLKILTSQFNDMSFQAIKTVVEQFKKDEEKRILLIDIREPEEIKKAKKAFGAKTILIKRDSVKNITSNMADANVFNYKYDYVIENNGTLDEFYWDVYKFANENILVEHIVDEEY